MVEDRILEFCRDILGSDGFVSCLEVGCNNCPFDKNNVCYGIPSERSEGRKIAQKYIEEHCPIEEFNWEQFKKGEIVVHCDTKEKARDFINKAIKEECYWGTGGIRTFWESDLLDETNKIYYNCGKDYGRLKYGNGKCAKENNIKTINWQIKEDIKMEKNFREVIADIKKGEVWESGILKIFIEYGCVKIHFNDENIRIKDDDIGIRINEKDKFKLQRKQYTFTEAFNAYEEGKEIESCNQGRKYKKGTEQFEDMLISDIQGKWYINN